MSKSPDEPFRRVEVITSVQRRRRWSVAEKVRLVEEAIQPAVQEHSFSMVALFMQADWVVKSVMLGLRA